MKYPYSITSRLSEDSKRSPNGVNVNVDRPCDWLASRAIENGWNEQTPSSQRHTTRTDRQTHFAQAPQVLWSWQDNGYQATDEPVLPPWRCARAWASFFRTGPPHADSSHRERRVKREWTKSMVSDPPIAPKRRK